MLRLLLFRTSFLQKRSRSAYDFSNRARSADARRQNKQDIVELPPVNLPMFALHSPSADAFEFEFPAEGLARNPEIRPVRTLCTETECAIVCVSFCLYPR